MRVVLNNLCMRYSRPQPRSCCQTVEDSVADASEPHTRPPFFKLHSFPPSRLSAPVTHSSAAAGALRLEPEYAAKSPVHLVHEGCRRVADRFLKVCLVEGDEGGDVDD